MMYSVKRKSLDVLYFYRASNDVWGMRVLYSFVFTELSFKTVSVTSLGFTELYAKAAKLFNLLVGTQWVHIFAWPDKRIGLFHVMLRSVFWYRDPWPYPWCNSPQLTMKSPIILVQIVDYHHFYTCTVTHLFAYSY